MPVFTFQCHEASGGIRFLYIQFYHNKSSFSQIVWSVGLYRAVIAWLGLGLPFGSLTIGETALAFLCRKFSGRFTLDQTIHPFCKDRDLSVQRLKVQLNPLVNHLRENLTLFFSFSLFLSISVPRDFSSSWADISVGALEPYVFRLLNVFDWRKKLKKLAKRYYKN